MNRTNLPPVPFPVQRLLCFALIMGMAIYAIVVAVVLEQNDGKGLARQPIPVLDTVASTTAVAFAMGALLVRSLLHRQAELREANARTGMRFLATLVPLAMIEGACLLALTAWLLNGERVPNLVTALVLLALAIYIVPFRDPDSAG
ncbi:MAG TPA: hypothetical protein VFZ65_13200 [Planctomycetota bacterium]|nr:hypothetical protein [Planctomycetota bacterium]